MVRALIVLSTVLLSLLALLGLFAYQSYVHGIPQTEELKKKGGSKLISMWMLEFAYWLLRPLVRGLVWCQIHPNTISWASVFFAGFGTVALTKGYFGYGATFSAVAFLLDAVDGMVARMAGMMSSAGAVLDSTLDRYTEFFFFVGLMFYYRFDSTALALVAAALCGSWMVSYSSAKAEAMQISIPRGTMRRPERLLILVFGTALAPIITPLIEGQTPYPLHYTVLLAVGFVAVFSNATAIYRVYCLYRVLSEKARFENGVTEPTEPRQKLVKTAMVASAIPTLVDFLVFVAMIELAHLNYVLATVVGVSVGTVLGYKIRMRWLQRKRWSDSGRATSQEWVIAVTNVIWNVLLVYGFVSWLELNVFVARLASAIAVALVWNWPVNFGYLFPLQKNGTVMAPLPTAKQEPVS